ncbi:cathepsin L2-like [Petaurus breviceps papuanus]|uniref:cathepsin L2-like n=1 Tax=Petaurus breviceps papuanus TaxID=3040969 RepID=UPI0036DBBA41
MTQFICLISLCWGLSYCFPTRIPELDTEWELFKSTYGRNYTEKEESFRREVWEKNLKFINDHNLLYKEGKLSYHLGMNEFGDLTDDELKDMLNPGIAPRIRRATTAKIFSNFSDLPKSVDWRKHGYVTPVRVQGKCGSCWAFSATGALEGQLFRKTGKLVKLSPQNLIDCDKFQGCRGGSVIGAFNYIKKNKGVVSEDCYPYEAKKNKECSYKSECTVVKIKNHVLLPFGNEKALMKAVATVGPVSVTIHVTKSFRYYKGGIIFEPKCKPRYTNHALLVVGYGSKLVKKRNKSGSEENQYEEKKFWILKNSWGTRWGEKGYLLIARDKNNHCGVATQAIYPIL